tara:strand:+ start:2354 stop:3289 length:936 start_codon:yes stop_codon:yes gene_type:complete
MTITGNEGTTVLDNIKLLQDMEKGVQDKLDAAVTLNKTAPTPELQTKIDDLVGQINKLSAIRTNLYKTIPATYNQQMYDSTQEYNTLLEKRAMIDLAEKNLNQLKRNTNSGRSNVGNKMRMVEINTYYSKKYKAYATVVYLMIILTLPILVLSILRKRSLIPNMIADLLIAIILVIGGYFVIRKLYDIMWRDNMNFDEYNWWYTIDANDPTVYQYNKSQWENTQFGDALRDKTTDAIKGLGMGCYGEGCCSSQTVYNETLGQCVVPGQTGVENFENRKLNYVLTEPITCPWENDNVEAIPYNKAESFSTAR